MIHCIVSPLYNRTLITGSSAYGLWPLFTMGVMLEKKFHYCCTPHLTTLRRNKTIESRWKVIFCLNLLINFVVVFESQYLWPKWQSVGSGEQILCNLCDVITFQARWLSVSRLLPAWARMVPTSGTSAGAMPPVTWWDPRSDLTLPHLATWWICWQSE